MTPLAPDERLRNHRTAKQHENQVAREERDLTLLQIDDRYLPVIRRLREIRLQEMRACWQTYVDRRTEIEEDYTE